VADGLIVSVVVSWVILTVVTWKIIGIEAKILMASLKRVNVYV
jgi:hypothetical protein